MIKISTILSILVIKILPTHAGLVAPTFTLDEKLYLKTSYIEYDDTL